MYATKSVHSCLHDMGFVGQMQWLPCMLAQQPLCSHDPAKENWQSGPVSLHLMGLLAVLDGKNLQLCCIQMPLLDRCSKGKNPSILGYSTMHQFAYQKSKK
jgi:hypothetical protein